MADKKTSHAQKERQKEPPKDGAAFDPMASFSKIAEDNVERAQALYAELAGWESKATERTKIAMGHLAELASETFDYATKLSAQWRNATIEATRRSADFFSARTNAGQ